jgi:serine/threonine protein kinase
VCYLKQLRIIHRDIKTANILLDSKLNVKLGDFGLAILADSNDPQRYNTCGTPSFMAPEVVNQLKYSFEIDMWSIGVVTYSLLCGTNPFICKKQ